MSGNDVIELGLGIVMGYRRGTNTQYTNQVLIKVLDTIVKRVDNLVGAKVSVKDRHGNTYTGKVIKPHARGRNNVVIATFKRNLPGQTVGLEARIYRLKK
ncbi:MAG: 50S ribosomal protein L35ae [Desulfurococcales archaeon]|nr:50S ribosomal protein L35ae [Desulfurococcales archaeon]